MKYFKYIVVTIILVMSIYYVNVSSEVLTTNIVNTKNPKIVSNIYMYTPTNDSTRIKYKIKNVENSKKLEYSLTLPIVNEEKLDSINNMEILKITEQLYSEYNLNDITVIINIIKY